MIIDTHAHLDEIENFDQAMGNARQAGVEGIVAVSISLESCIKTIRLSRQCNDPKIYLALGMHPSDADTTKVDDCVKLMYEHRERLTAVGEIGLDFWYKWARKDKEKKDEQRMVFRKQLEAALDLDLPVIVHTRGTWRQALDIVKEVGNKKVEFHWYSGPIDVLDDILAEGFYVSTSPSVAFSPQSQEAMAHAPIEQTMIETDSPVFFKDRETNDSGFRAEPKDVLRTLDAYSRLKGMDKEDALKILNANARRFFNLK